MISRFIDKFIFYFLLVLLIVFGFSLLKNLQRVKRVNLQIASKEAEVNEIKKEGDDLQKKLEFTQSPQYQEQQLRDQLGLAKQDEIVVILPPDDVLRKLAPTYEDTKVVVQDPNWKKWMKLFL